jgi:CspA family cold shock protein
MLNWIKSLFSSDNASATTNKKRPRSGDRKTGVIRYFNHKRGFGFIESPETETDIFVHVKDVQGRLRKGDRVSFSIIEEKKGPRATEVELV